jgi:O-antigen/teichoic acid export membrane protein
MLKVYTIVSQLIGAIFLILAYTKISEKDFASFSLDYSISTIISVCLTLRYELVFPHVSDLKKSQYQRILVYVVIGLSVIAILIYYLYVLVNSLDASYMIRFGGVAILSLSIALININNFYLMSTNKMNAYGVNLLLKYGVYWLLVFVFNVFDHSHATSAYSIYIIMAIIGLLLSRLYGGPNEGYDIRQNIVFMQSVVKNSPEIIKFSFPGIFFNTIYLQFPIIISEYFYSDSVTSRITMMLKYVGVVSAFMTSAYAAKFYAIKSKDIQTNIHSSYTSLISVLRSSLPITIISSISIVPISYKLGFAEFDAYGWLFLISFVILIFARSINSVVTYAFSLNKSQKIALKFQIRLIFLAIIFYLIAHAYRPGYELFFTVFFIMSGFLYVFNSIEAAKVERKGSCVNKL